jgi:hypothetical protein
LTSKGSLVQSQYRPPFFSRSLTDIRVGFKISINNIAVPCPNFDADGIIERWPQL